MRNFISAVACVILSVSGCAAGKINLSDTGEIKVDVHHAEAMHIEEVSIYEVEGGIEVTGLVRRHQHSVPSKGTIQIQVIGPNGAVLIVENAEYAITGRMDFLPPKRILSGIGREEDKFSKQIRIIPPRGSSVLLTLKNAELR